MLSFSIVYTFVKQSEKSLILCETFLCTYCKEVLLKSESIGAESKIVVSRDTEVTGAVGRYQSKNPEL